MAKLCGRPTKICLTCRHHLRCHQQHTCKQWVCARNPCRDATSTIPCDTFQARPCDSNKTMRNGACRMHGGKNIGGVGHWNYQGKGFSTVLPRRMQLDYLDARNNPQRLSLEDEIAELRALRADLWRMLEGDSAVHVAAVKDASGSIAKAYKAARVAYSTGNAEKLAESMQAIGDAVDHLHEALSPIAAMDAARAQASDLAVKTERLLRTENARVTQERGMVSLEVALADQQTLIMALVSAVEKYVRDGELVRRIRRAAGDEYSRLTAASAGRSYSLGRREASAVSTGRDSRIIDAEHSETAD